MDRIRLFIIEEEPGLLRLGTRLLNAFSGLEIVYAAMSAKEALARMAELAGRTDVVLCDLYLPSSIKVTKHIKAHYPSIEVLIFTAFEDENKVLKAIRAGASGYLLRTAHEKKIYEAIVDVFHGGTVIEPRLARKLLKYFLIEQRSLALLKGENDSKNIAIKASLTLRELECLQIVAKGLSNHETASVLSLSKATIRTHLEHIYQKLDVNNRVEAITEGIRQGIIDP